MNAFNHSLAAKIQINVKLLTSASFAALSYFIWPTSTKWWGFGVMSVFLSFAAILLMAKALRAMTQLYRRDKALGDYAEQGNQPKFSKMASQDALKNAGMYDE